MSRRSDSNNDKSIKYNDKDYRENNDLYNRQHNRNVSSDTVESSTFSSDSDDSDKNERKGKKGSDGIIKIKKVKVNTAAENTQLKRVKRNLIVLDVVMVKNTLASSASNSNITQVIYSPPTNDTSSDPVAKQLEIKIRSVVCMSMLAGLPPKQFPCEFCTEDFEPAFNNVTSFCVLKGIWANSNNATSLEQNLKWMGDSNYCEWIGVTCGPNSQNIIGLDIRFPNTPKVLLNDIGKLTSLQTLSISGDAKIPSGVIPPSIFQLEALNTLRIESTLLSGPVPDTFDKMTSLTTLQLIRNVQLGAVPKSIGTLSLTTLAISQQGLTGAIPDFIGQSETLQANLQNLDLSINQLTGNIPESLMQLKALKTLNLNTNLLSGDIPATLAQSNFQNTLTVLDLGANAFQNKIPDSISTIKNLLTLSLGKNSLNGQIPASLVKLVKLSDLVLNDNQLTGNIPDGIGGLNIVNLILTNNTMTGVVPTSVCQRQYTTCDLTLTGLTSPVKCAVWFRVQSVNVINQLGNSRNLQTSCNAKLEVGFLASKSDKKARHCISITAIIELDGRRFVCLDLSTGFVDPESPYWVRNGSMLNHPDALGSIMAWLLQHDLKILIRKRFPKHDYEANSQLSSPIRFLIEDASE
nr:12779_t:CDS:2 [Entrophospora candida]